MPRCLSTLQFSHSNRYHNSHLYIIDVSQSVEHDHPSAFDFLRSDIRNIDEYFTKKSGGEVRTLGGKGTFEFIVNEKLWKWDEVTKERVVVEEKERDDEEEEEEWKDVVRSWLVHGVGLNVVEPVSTNETISGSASAGSGSVSTSAIEADTVSSLSGNTKTSKKSSADEVFMASYIPRNMMEVYDPERDMDLMAEGKGKDLIYAGVIGMAEEKKRLDEGSEEEPKREKKVGVLKNGSTAQEVEETSGQSERRKGVRFEDDEEEEVDEEGSDGSGDEDEDGVRKPRGFRHEDKDSKKVRNWSIISWISTS